MRSICDVLYYLWHCMRYEGPGLLMTALPPNLRHRLDTSYQEQPSLHLNKKTHFCQCLSNSELFNYVYWDLLVFCWSLCLPHCHDQLLLAVTSCQLPVSRDTRAWQHVSTASCGKTSWQHVSHSRCIKENKQQVFTNLTSIFLEKIFFPYLTS